MQAAWIGDGGVEKEAHSAISKMRLEIIRLHNRVCAEQMEEEGEYALDLFALFGDNHECFCKLLRIAVQIEGFEEAMKHRTEEEKIERLRSLENQLQNELQKHSLKGDKK